MSQRLYEPSEEDIQTEIVLYVKWTLGYEALVYAGKGTHKRLGGVLPEGHSDLIIVGDSKVWFMEVKSKHGKRRPSQIEFAEKMLRQGIIVYVVRSKDDVAEIIGV